jgi:hypothetical protein
MHASLVALLGAAVLGGCSELGDDDPALSKSEQQEVPIPDVPVPPADGPRLGAVANVTPVYDRPSDKGNLLGYLHAGARVARAETPLSTLGCADGWYAVRPRGFVCASGTATTDLRHPTLVAMSIRPQLDASLPYTYARTTKKTSIYKVDSKRDQGVEPVDTLPSNSGLAVVGSWEAKGPDGETVRLAMMMDGRFVAAADLKAAEATKFRGVEFGEKRQLPVGFVVKRGVTYWAVDGTKAEKRNPIEYHQILPLTGTFRTIEGLRFWELEDGLWVRHRDVTVLRQRHKVPDFVQGDTRWADISIVTGAMVLYEGSRPVYGTLVSVGRDRLGDPETTQSTPMGEFAVIAKHTTGAKVDATSLAEGVALHDAPWVLEMENGKLVHGAYWHDRFGIEHGPGNVQLSPDDAAFLWRWATPEMPESWHGVTTHDGKTIINIRK